SHICWIWSSAVMFEILKNRNGLIPKRRVAKVVAETGDSRTHQRTDDPVVPYRLAGCGNCGGQGDAHRHGHVGMAALGASLGDQLVPRGPVLDFELGQ